jgi:hypothetical protein
MLISIIRPIAIILSIAGIWVALDSINTKYFGFLQVSDFIYSIYWLSGIRMVAIILFGWLGVIGLWIGYFIGGTYLRGFNPQDAICLGILSALAPMIAYKTWQKITGITNDFDGVKFDQLFGLVLFYSLVVAVFRGSYFFLTVKPSGLQEIALIFSSNVIGTLLLVYMLKYLQGVYKRMNLKS